MLMAPRSHLIHLTCLLRAAHKPQPLTTITFTLTNFDRHRSSSTMARTYDDALSHLAALQSNKAVTSLFTTPTPSSNGAKVDLNSLAIPEMLAWAQRSGISQDDLSKLRCIHVAGTKGKGSVCAYLTALLTHNPAAGKVGTYTSPHLVSVRERIAIDGAPISKDLFTKYFFQVWDSCTEAARAEYRARKNSSSPDDIVEEISEETLAGLATKPFFFRFLTIVAFRAFLSEGVTSAVIECGIGGEYDSTNILPASSITSCVITQLGIDHVGMLGATLPEIAWHKAGIMKPGRPCYTRKLSDEKTMAVLRQRAEEKGATLVEVEDEDVESWGGVQPDVNMAGSLEGQFQKYNQSLAIHAALAHLSFLSSLSSPSPKPSSLSSLPPSLTTPLTTAHLRGRCETHPDPIQTNITYLLDGAHTAESLIEVSSFYTSKLPSYPNTTTILLFNQQDRDSAHLVRTLLSHIPPSLSPTPSPTPTPTNKPPFSHAIFTRNDLSPSPSPPRSQSTPTPQPDLQAQHKAAEALRSHSSSSGTTTSVTSNVSDAVSEIRARAKGEEGSGEGVLVLVTGSLHLVGALLRVLEPGGEL
ncbi:FolC bifunctional protein [Xylariaceae sp. FL1272]|nr:FolC bifunctional protein [Xylariaceae sp. FL1272]